MRRLARTLVRVLMAGVLLVAMVFSADAKDESTKPDPNDPKLVTRGKMIYAEHCASCHGANLEGQPDWQHRLPNGRMPAPPHARQGTRGTTRTSNCSI
jgi:mono/diheme cytochrome c family protein